MDIYFFVTDETFCMSRVSKIVTHCGQQEERGRICITWTRQTPSKLLGQGYRSAHSGVSWPRACSMYYLVPREYIVHSSRMTSIGLCGINVQYIIGYRDDWNSVVSLCVNNNKSFVSYNKGITPLELASCKSQVDCKSQNAWCTVAPFQRGTLLTDQGEASLFKIDEEGRVQIFAGTKVEGSQDVPVSECQFKQPIGNCVWLRCIYLQRSIKLVENNHASFRNSEI